MILDYGRIWHINNIGIICIQDGELTFRMMKMKRKRMKQKKSSTDKAIDRIGTRYFFQGIERKSLCSSGYSTIILECLFNFMTRITKMEILMNIQNIFLASRIYSHQLQSVPMPEIRYLCWPHSRS